MWAYTPCHPEDKKPADQNEAWSVNANNTITELASGLCLDTKTSTAFNGSAIILNECLNIPTQQVGQNESPPVRVPARL